MEENPMTGYMQNIIFTRIIGHDDIEQSGYWIDSSNCWLCEEYAKMTVTFNPLEDRAVMSRNIDRLEALSYKINQYVQKEIIEAGMQDLDSKVEVVLADDVLNADEEVKKEERYKHRGAPNFQKQYKERLDEHIANK
jgi:phosphoribosylaminoimidazole-succinocarboxamide synthase